MSRTRPSRESLLRPDITTEDAQAFTRHDDPTVRRTALLVLSRRASEERLDSIGEDPAHSRAAQVLRTAVLTGLEDTSALVRREAAEQAGRHAWLAAALLTELRTRLTTDDELLCREAAAFALGESGAAAAARGLVEHLDKEPDPAVREAIAGALGALGDPSTVETVIGLTTGEKPAVRRRAVVALAAFDHPDAEAAIHRASQDRDRFVREAAEWLLRDDTTVTSPTTSTDDELP